MVTLILSLAGLGLLVAGAELLVRGASRLAISAGLTPLVVGLTVVAYGTSAPEMAVSTLSALKGQADLSFGNVVGSNIFNVLFILGASALLAPLVVARNLIWIDVPVMIGASLLAWGLALDGVISRLDGVILVLLLVAYTAFLVWMARRETMQGDGVPEGGGSTLSNVLLVLAGLVLLVLGSRWLVEGAVALAKTMGVSELVIGLTIVAAGTSLPEVATSLLATARGQRDIAVGNVVGSNIFNIFGVLGVSSVIAPAGVGVAPSAMSFDIPAMVAAAFACLPIFFTGHRIARWEGFVFLSYYAAYTLYLILDATRHDALTTYKFAMATVVIPLTILTGGVVLLRALREHRLR